MKKFFIISLAISLWVQISGVSAPICEGAEDSRSGLTGVYQVIFTTDQGQSWPLKLTIVDLKNGHAELSGEYKGYPINLTGEVTGNVEDEGAICNFTLHKPGLINGRTEFTVRKINDQYQLQGRASGSYFNLGKSGQINGTLEGSRSSSPTPPAPAPVPVQVPVDNPQPTVALSLMAAALIAAGLYFIWNRHRYK